MKKLVGTSQIGMRMTIVHVLGLYCVQSGFSAWCGWNLNDSKRWCYSPHFTGKVSECQRSQVTYANHRIDVCFSKNIASSKFCEGFWKGFKAVVLNRGPFGVLFNPWNIWWCLEMFSSIIIWIQDAIKPSRQRPGMLLSIFQMHRKAHHNKELISVRCQWYHEWETFPPRLEKDTNLHEILWLLSNRGWDWKWRQLHTLAKEHWPKIGTGLRECWPGPAVLWEKSNLLTRHSKAFSSLIFHRTIYIGFRI